MFKFFFNNLNLSSKKTILHIRSILNLSKQVFEILVYLNYSKSKHFKILKKIFLYVVNEVKSKNKNFFNLKIKNILVLKGSIIKKVNYRAKGNLNFFKKKYCNILVNSYI